MSQLDSKFDIIHREGTPLAHAALAEVLRVPGGATVDPVTGTPEPGSIVAGSIVAMDPVGGAGVLPGDALVTPSSGTLVATAPQMFFVVLDGNVDPSGAFTGQLSCLHGGFKCLTEEYVSGPAYKPGDPLIVTLGQFDLPSAFDGTEQYYGYVGPEGEKNGTLSVIVPQNQPQSQQ